jgi:ribonucleoside-triphosphate reductase
LGYAYLPQCVVTKEDYDEYVYGLVEIDLDGTNTFDELTDEECATGACPIR